jgi:hypothetical protein
MKKYTQLACSVGALAIMAIVPTFAQAETVVTQTYVQTKEAENVNNIDFTDFDVNKDGSYSMAEVGEKLFYLFDTDGNEVIDNVEWNKINFYTITPMEVESFRYVDSTNAGQYQLEDYSYDVFYKESGLMKFDEDKDGLSAAEFIDEGYEVLDTDEDKMITLKEWQRAYLESRPKHNQAESYQQ